MAIMIKEYISDSPITYIDQPQLLTLTEANEPTSTISDKSIMVEIEGIHAAPFATRNYTRYMPEALKSSVATWTKPYKRPLIKHHNEKDGEIIGRIINASYETKDTLTDTPAIRFLVNVPGEKAIDEVKNGILATTSIGVIAHDVRCSICGTHLETGESCEHERGHVYDGETCYWDIYNMEAKELSYVIVPSDSYSKTIAYYPAKENSKGFSLTEQLEIKGEEMIKEETAPMNGDAQQSLAESTEETKVTLQEMEALQEEKAKIEGVNQELTEKLAAAEEKVTDLEAQLKNSEELRESLEGELTKANTALKEALAETIMIMREALGKKALDLDSVKARTEDSMRDSIVDMKEELTMKHDALPTAPVDGKAMIETKVEDPTLHTTDDKVEEKTTVSRINLKEELNDIFGTLMSTHK